MDDARKLHELKCWPEFYKAIADGSKRFEIRENDRGFQVGDTLLLREWKSGYGYTGRETSMTITYMTEWGQQPGHVAMGIEPFQTTTQSERAAALREAARELREKSAHVLDNSQKLARWEFEKDEARCRELCAMYLKECADELDRLASSPDE